MRYLIIGAKTSDEIYLEDGQKLFAEGGPSLFISNALTDLGEEVKTLDEYKEPSIRVSIFDDGSGRRAEAVELDNHKKLVKEDLSDLEGYDCILISTITNEVSNEIINFIREQFKGPLIVDLQGFQRIVSPEDHSVRKIAADEIVLKSADVVKMSEAEFNTQFESMDAAAASAKENGNSLIITRAAKGCDFIGPDGVIKQFPLETGKMKNTVGAGDTFLSSFSSFYFSKDVGLEDSILAAQKYTKEFLASRDGNKGE